MVQTSPLRQWIFAGVMLCALMGVRLAEATTVLPTTLKEMAREAEVIFLGKPIEFRPYVREEGSAKSIFTAITFQVEKGMKGELSGGSITLHFLGGFMADKGMNIPGMPLYEAGRRYIILASPSKNWMSPVCGFNQGTFTIFRNPLLGVDQVLKDDHCLVRGIEEGDIRKDPSCGQFELVRGKNGAEDIEVTAVQQPTPVVEARNADGSPAQVSLSTQKVYTREEILRMKRLSAEEFLQMIADLAGK